MKIYTEIMSVAPLLTEYSCCYSRTICLRIHEYNTFHTVNMQLHVKSKHHTSRKKKDRNLAPHSISSLSKVAVRCMNTLRLTQYGSQTLLWYDACRVVETLKTTSSSSRVRCLVSGTTKKITKNDNMLRPAYRQNAPVGVTLASSEGKVRPRALLTALLTQMVKAAPISRWDRGKASEK